eukprot:3740848-Pyramimonas_sp.AAC.1
MKPRRGCRSSVGGTIEHAPYLKHMRPRLALGSESAACACDMESLGIDNVVPLRHHVPCKTSTMQTSKAFRCTLPMRRDDQLTNL